MDGTWIVVPVTFNHVLRAHLQLDTGASATMVSSRIANNLGLITLGSKRGITVGGIITVPIARLNSLNVGGAEVSDLVISIHNFSPHPRIDGLLGMDFLKHFHVSLNADRKLLVLGPR
jgi:predicted aspartyl protease